MNQLWTAIQSKSHTLSLTGYAWEFRSNALRDTFEHAPFIRHQSHEATLLWHLNIVFYSDVLQKSNSLKY